jgi:hypothetical protein
MLVISKMAPGPKGDAQRGKVNMIYAFAADQDSGVAGAYQGTTPPDLRGVLGHLLVQRYGINPDRLLVSKGESNPFDISFGSAYGELQIAAGTVGEAIADIERRGLMRVTCQPTGLITIAPDILSSSAAFSTAVSRTWTADTIMKLRIDRKAAHEVGQVKVTGFSPSTGDSYPAKYPKMPTKLGAIVDVSDLILGTMNAAENHAIREFRQRNAGWSITIDTSIPWLPRPWTRHLINCVIGDKSSAALANLNMLLTGYTWRYAKDEHGANWELSLSMRELSPWA